MMFGTQSFKKNMCCCIFITHIVFQALNDLNAIVTQIKLSQVDKVLKTLNLSNPVTLNVNVHKISVSTYTFTVILAVEDLWENT